MSRQVKERYEFLFRVLRDAVHELPAGVLWGANGASEKECKELLEALVELEQVCSVLGRNHADFIEDCRWHLEHYPHYLSRQRHFPSYDQYIRDRKGPQRVRDHDALRGGASR
jgi:hypothetical protein